MPPDATTPPHATPVVDRAARAEIEEPDPLESLRASLKAQAVAPAAAAAAARTEPALQLVQPDRVGDDERRRQLWRDSATILIGVVLALLVGQAVFPQPVAGPIGSPTPPPSGISIGSFGPPVSIAPIATFGPIINPSLGIDRTPTPIPVITMGPTPSPSPSPSLSPSPGPSATRKPTPKPTVKPTTRPATPTPVVTPPPPTAQFSWSVTLYTVDFTNLSTGDTSWSWDFGEPGATSPAENPSHTYPVTTEPFDTYTVTLTVMGPGGTDSVQHTVTVPPPP